MKFLKKFNESSDVEIVTEYLKFVFAYFIDDNDAKVQEGNNTINNTSYWVVSIKEPLIAGCQFDVDDYLTKMNNLVQFAEDIKTAIDRVKDKFPDIKVSFDIDETGENNAWKNDVVRRIEIFFAY